MAPAQQKRQRAEWRAFGQGTAFVLRAALLLVVGGTQAEAQDATSLPTFKRLVIDDDPPKQPYYKMVGDLTGDGHPEIVVAGRTGPLVMYSRPDWSKTLIAEGGYDGGVNGEFADLNRDGKLDIVMGGVVWFENPGTAGGPWPVYRVDSQSVHDIDVADLNGDGRLDIVCRDQSAFGRRGNVIFIYHQQHSGAWQKMVLDCPHGEGLKVADVDGDSRLDIVIGGIWLRNDSGRWTEHAYAPDWTELDTKIEVGDINGDGRPDIVLTPSELKGERYRISWFESPAGDKDRPWEEHVIVPDIECVVHALGLGDFNQDGMLDIAYAEMHQGEDPDEVVVLFNSGNGARWNKQVIDTEGSHDIRVADLDGDGDLDVVGANHAGVHPVVMWENQLVSGGGRAGAGSEQQGEPRSSAGPVILDENAVDMGAGHLACYRVSTPTAVYYLEKSGAGLSSLTDKSGNDWLGFHPEPGSGSAGEYRGFPNAVHQQAGNYFHPRNSGTDPSTTTVEHVAPNRVIISAESGNGKWACRYDFYPTHCTFTMTKMPQGFKYWALYEGTPGGQYDDTDWWMISGEDRKHPLTTKHEADIPGPEWIAFGDPRLERALVLVHDRDDEHPDCFYQMRHEMTVFGFGRRGLEKFLDGVPQSVSIGLVESTDHGAIDRAAERFRKSPWTEPGVRLSEYERYALTHQGDAGRGRALFLDEQRTKCNVCHKVDGSGGEVGPDLSQIGGKFDRPHLIESLLQPSRQIVEGYRTSVIVTTDGQIETGIVKQQSPREITLFEANGRQRQIPTAEIAQRRESSVSLMPQGLAETLSAAEFTDLIAYLETLRSGEAKHGAGVSGAVALPPGFTVRTVATGLTGCTALEVTGDGRILLCEQTGALRVIKDGRLLEEPFLTVDVDSSWERGLIGVTVHPDFPATPYVYICYVANDPYPHHRVSRFTADGDVSVPGSETILLVGDDQRKLGGKVPNGHQGGAVHFGPDGKLYIAIGEQTAETPAQDLGTFQGKILRINPVGTIPGDNPFLDRTTGKYRAIWALGCRNPFTFAFCRTTGEMLINDVGGKCEEINRGIAGANYGWPIADHGPIDDPQFVGPIHIYPQASIAGGDFCQPGSRWPEEYHGRYFFADFVHGWIKTLDPRRPEQAETFVSGIRRPVDLRFAADGSLYVLLRNAWVIDGRFQARTGTLLKIEPVDPEISRWGQSSRTSAADRPPSAAPSGSGACRRPPDPRAPRPDRRSSAPRCRRPRGTAPQSTSGAFTSPRSGS